MVTGLHLRQSGKEGGVTWRGRGHGCLATEEQQEAQGGKASSVGGNQARGNVTGL